MSQTYDNVILHVIFATKERERWITPAIKPQLHGYIVQVIKNNAGRPLAVGGTDDHVHLLLGIKPAVSIADAVRKAKAYSSGWIHRNYPELGDFAWQRGYAVFSVSESNKQQVVRYILGQEQHHRQFSVREEIMKLLEKNGIEYDEKFMWV